MKPWARFAAMAAQWAYFVLTKVQVGDVAAVDEQDNTGATRDDENHPRPARVAITS